MKVLLVNPNYTKGVYGGSTGGYAPPMGLTYIAATLREGGIEVILLDANALSLEMDDIRREIGKTKPDIVGITATTPLVEDAGAISRIVKEINKNTTVVVGGPHPSAIPDDLLLRTDSVDVCVFGEGELTALELVQKIGAAEDLSMVKGIAYRSGEEITVNERRPLITDLDTLPFPAWELLPMEKYRYTLPLGKKGGYAVVLCDRGCPFSCTFCSQRSIFSKKVRFRNATNIVDEVECLVKDYGITALSLSSSTFTVNRRKTMALCDELIRRKMDVKWQCTTRVNLVDFELLTRMKQAGCEIVSYGIESASQGVLDILKKEITTDQVREAVHLTKKAGIGVYMDFMLGTPGETRKMIIDTIDFARELDGDYAQFSITTPFPGSELFDMAQKEGLIKTDDFSKFRYYAPTFNIEGISSEELEKLRTKAFRSFYLRPSYVMKQALRMRSLNDFKKLVEQSISLRVFTRNKKRG